MSQLFRSAYALLPADSSRPCYITIQRRFPLHSTDCYFVSNTPNLLIPAPFKSRASALSHIAGQPNHRGLRVRADRGRALALSALIPVLNPLLHTVYSKLGVANRWLVIRTSPRGDPLIQPHTSSTTSRVLGSDLAEQPTTYS